MKAIARTRYGSPDVLELEEVPKPRVGPLEVRVAVHAAGIHPGDVHLLRGRPYPIRLTGLGLFRPKHAIPGTDVAGRVDAVGERVTRHAVGDHVFGWCDGAFAEYASAPEDNLVSMPPRLTFEQAAAVPVSAVTALQALRDSGGVSAGQHVIVVGASGGVGTFAVQLAKGLGAEVTGVCSSRNVELLGSLGADHVVDYTQHDFAANGRRYDVLLDLAGRRSLAACRRALQPDGTYVFVGAPSGRFKGLGRPLAAVALSPFVSQALRMLVSAPNRADLTALAELIDAGTLMPVVGRHYELSETPAALRQVEAGHTRGKGVITIAGDR
jgi:NADPH:quinone reductase-like Zn-dependent oxidoreductase